MRDLSPRQRAFWGLFWVLALASYANAMLTAAR